MSAEAGRKQRGVERTERVEYRVVGDKDGRTWTLRYFEGLRENAIAESRRPYPAFTNLRVQQSTLTRTPWTDLPDNSKGPLDGE